MLETASEMVGGGFGVQGIQRDGSGALSGMRLLKVSLQLIIGRLFVADRTAACVSVLHWWEKCWVWKEKALHVLL